MKILKRDNTNILNTILSLLNVRYTKVYTEHLLDDSPHGYSLYGLSNMLSVYGIDSVAVDVKDKQQDIHELELPFVAYTSCNYAVVTSVDKERVDYVCNRKPMSMPLDDFLKMWSGIALLVKASAKSIEPGYSTHRRLDTLNIGQNVLFFIALLTLAAIGYSVNRLYGSWPHNILLATNLIGLYISYLLILKQLHIHSAQADKICSSIRKGDCNKVLDSPAASFLGIIGWSEVGFGYFLSNLLILLFLPALFPYLVIVNTCAVCYSFWSVGYQTFVIKFFCPLCLIVQAIFWVVFLVELCFGLIHIPAISFLPIAVTICIFIVFILGVNIIVPKMFQEK